LDPIDPIALAVLAVACLGTSILSAVVGMAGGITLLSVMLLFLDPILAIPLHGVIQLVSNSSRAVIQRDHVKGWILWRYGALLLPMGFVGLQIVEALPATLTKVLIGAFVLVATWFPGLILLGAHPEKTDPRRRFVVLGGVVGVLNMTVGATGPLIAPFFLNIGLDRRSLVGTKAACQSLGHLAKILVFGVAGFAFLPWLAPLALLCVMVVVGTWIGSRLLDRVSEVWFTRLYKFVLTAIAVRLVVWEAAALLDLR
jgi:uncharacterized membrane protein YfcA